MDAYFSCYHVADRSIEVDVNIDKEVSKFARNAATTFAPRASGATKNPAFKGSLLYTVFDVQAWLALVVGGLLSFNVIFPSDQPDIARLMGMWSIWMFTIPSEGKRMHCSRKGCIKSPISGNSPCKCTFTICMEELCIHFLR